jgi:molybdate transport system substrate-binding protein
MFLRTYVLPHMSAGRSRVTPAGEGAMTIHGRLPSGAFAAIGFVAAVLAGPAAMAQHVTVFAAASLASVLDDINAAWSAETGKSAIISYAASSALARQIEAGAPADVFISADLDWMAYLSERGLTRADTEVELLGNRIVLISPADAEAAVEIVPGFDIAGLLGDDGHLAMANVDAVPAGRYGKAALEALGAWDAVAGRVAQAENVRAALALVSTGEAPLGIVYRTDAVADPAVKVLGLFPEGSHPPIVYPAGVLSEATGGDTDAFMAFLRTEIAADLFAAQGFTVLAPVQLHGADAAG